MKALRKSHVFPLLAVALATASPLAAWSQQAAPAAPRPKTQVTVHHGKPPMQVKQMSSTDLKAAIGDAMQSGDLDQKDGQELIQKITDIETLMQQFDFMRDQERHMMSSIGSPFH